MPRRQSPDPVIVAGDANAPGMWEGVRRPRFRLRQPGSRRNARQVLKESTTSSRAASFFFRNRHGGMMRTATSISDRRPGGAVLAIRPEPLRGFPPTLCREVLYCPTCTNKCPAITRRLDRRLGMFKVIGGGVLVAMVAPLAADPRPARADNPVVPTRSGVPWCHQWATFQRGRLQPVQQYMGQRRRAAVPLGPVPTATSETWRGPSGHRAA